MTDEDFERLIRIANRRREQAFQFLSLLDSTKENTDYLERRSHIEQELRARYEDLMFEAGFVERAARFFKHENKGVDV